MGVIVGRRVHKMGRPVRAVNWPKTTGNPSPIGNRDVVFRRRHRLRLLKLVRSLPPLDLS
jgi:hypothetical protein